MKILRRMALTSYLVKLVFKCLGFLLNNTKLAFNITLYFAKFTSVVQLSSILTDMELGAMISLIHFILASILLLYSLLQFPDPGWSFIKGG